MITLTILLQSVTYYYCDDSMRLGRFICLDARPKLKADHLTVCRSDQLDECDLQLTLVPPIQSFMQKHILQLRHQCD